MPYTVQFTTSALREFSALERVDQRRVAIRIDALANNPFPSGSKKMKGEPDHYRIRVGDYRVIYRVDGMRVIVLIVKIGHRRDVYR